MNTTKQQLTERWRGKGGTLVRVVAGKWASEEVMVVKDLMARKSWNKPDRVGVGPLDRGIAFGVGLDEIEVLS